MTTEETAAVAASGAVVGLCPTTEANLGDGIFPLPDFLAAGGTFGVGSDSNVTVSPSSELRPVPTSWSWTASTPPSREEPGTRYSTPGCSPRRDARFWT